jgi:hypothetical protein
MSSDFFVKHLALATEEFLAFMSGLAEIFKFKADSVMSVTPLSQKNLSVAT